MSKFWQFHTATQFSYHCIDHKYSMKNPYHHSSKHQQFSVLIICYDCQLFETERLSASCHNFYNFPGFSAFVTQYILSSLYIHFQQQCLKSIFVFFGCEINGGEQSLYNIWIVICLRNSITKQGGKVSCIDNNCFYHPSSSFAILNGAGKKAGVSLQS